MGLLDDLKRQAEKSRLEKELEEARQAELVRVYRTNICPAMLNIHSYLHELIGLLTTPVLASFDFPGIGKVENLEQGNYNILIDSQREPKLITLRFDCLAKEERRYTVTPKSAADDARQFLTDHKVVFSDWAIRDGIRQSMGLVIQCRLRVPVELAFEVDIEKGGIRVVSYNFGELGEKSFFSRHESINADWLDKLGYYILRQGEGFGTLSLSEHERTRIRELVKEQKRRDEILAAETHKEMILDNDPGSKWLKLFNKPPR
jgi:hypothetical protein